MQSRNHLTGTIPPQLWGHARDVSKGVAALTAAMQVRTCVRTFVLYIVSLWLWLLPPCSLLPPAAACLGRNQLKLQGNKLTGPLPASWVCACSSWCASLQRQPRVQIDTAAAAQLERELHSVASLAGLPSDTDDLQTARRKVPDSGAVHAVYKG